MRFVFELHNNFTGPKKVEVTHLGTLEEARVKYAYVRYGGDLYEWVLYNPGNWQYDYEAIFSQVFVIPWGSTAFDLNESSEHWKYGSTKCECGSDKVKSPYHSHWCPKDKKSL
jgi:hypothetical protein